MGAFTKTYTDAVEQRLDIWVPACGGLEQPATYRDGRRYLYVYNPGRHEHGWLDLGTDIVRMDSPS